MVIRSFVSRAAMSLVAQDLRARHGMLAVTTSWSRFSSKSMRSFLITSTSNWSNERLSEAQVVYAANDAYAAYRVWAALTQK